jgi:hypothetical protein
MLLKISVNKAHYDKGQIFPFLIALIVVVIIIAMITLNLGQIAVFKTDVSNAADAGALAGASTLSAYLLGTGLKSDMMCGDMIVSVVAAIILFCFVVTIPIGIAVCIAFLIKQLVTYFQALEDGKMAWSNAKKTALQQRPSFKEFLRGVYGISDPYNLSEAETAAKYKIYSLGDDPDSNDADLKKKIKNYTQSGFSRFMEEGGYWNESAWGKIEPGKISPAIVTTGYGWNREGQNSYASGDSYKRYQNYVEVQVTANVIYPLQLYNPISKVLDRLKDYISDNFGHEWWEQVLSWFFGFILSLVSGILATTMPGGLTMGSEEEDIVRNTDENPITVTVKRVKKDNNLGLWKFRYGGNEGVQASATSHVYRENGDENIEPLLFDDLYEFIKKAFGEAKWYWDWFKTEKHLFESELQRVR